MGAMAFQITSLTIVYSTVYSGADQRKHQSFESLAFVRGIHRWPVNSPHERPVTRKMFPFDDVIMKFECVSYGPLLTIPWWRALPGLLSLYPIFMSSHCNFEDRTSVDEIYGCPIFHWVAETRWQGTRIVAPAMAGGWHTLLTIARSHAHTHAHRHGLVIDCIQRIHNLAIYLYKFNWIQKKCWYIYTWNKQKTP